MYHLFYTDHDCSPAEYVAAKPHLMSYRYADQDDALGKARQILSYGGVPWEICSDDGTVLNRDEIDRTLRRRAAELADRPKVY